MLNLLMKLICLFAGHSKATMYVKGGSCEKISYCTRCESTFESFTEHPHDVKAGETCHRCGATMTHAHPA